MKRKDPGDTINKTMLTLIMVAAATSIVVQITFCVLQSSQSQLTTDIYYTTVGLFCISGSGKKKKYCVQPDES